MQVASFDVIPVVPKKRGRPRKIITETFTANLPAPEICSEVEPAATDMPEHSGSSGLDTIQYYWRLRQDLLRAHNRIELQCSAICRRWVAGDLVEASKLLSAAKKGRGPLGLLAVLDPYLQAMYTLKTAQKDQEKILKKMGKQHPLFQAFAKDVRGIAALSFVGLLGEAGREIQEYRSPAALWKRFGLAVIEGARQRRVTGDAALIHGYAPQRRAFAYNIGVNLMMQQKEGDPYRTVYDKRKALELTRCETAGHANNRATRYMTKVLLRDLWFAARNLGA